MLKDRVIDLMRHGHHQRYPAGDIADSVIAAVLDALQEPSEGMARYGTWEAESCVKDDPCGQAGRHVWGTMLAKFREEQGV